MDNICLVFIILAAIVFLGIGLIQLLNKILVDLHRQDELVEKDIFGYKEINKILTKNEEQQRGNMEKFKSLKNVFEELDNIHRFLTAIRKSDMEININVSDKGINYELSSKKPFNEDNWNKAIKRMIEEKEITKEEAKIFNKMKIA